MLRRILCLLLVVCIMFSSFGELKAKAVVLELTAGTACAVAGTLAVGSLLIALGLSPGNSSDDFWKLADAIANAIPDVLKTSIEVAEMGILTLLKAWNYSNSYYFHQDIVEFVNDYIFTGTESYDEATGTVVTTAPVQQTAAFTKQTYYDKALGYMFKNYPTEYEFCKAAQYRTMVECDDGMTMYVWSSAIPGMNGEHVTFDSTASYGVIYRSDGTMVMYRGSGTAVLGVTPTYVSTVELTYKATGDYSVNDVNEVVDVTVMPVHVDLRDSPNDNGDGDSVVKAYVAIKLLETKDKIESMTQEEALSGKNSSPEISVNTSTGAVIESNGDTIYAVDGMMVGVDAEIAVASILISLGISPGTVNTDFRTLVSNVVSSLEENMTFEFDSVTYGSGSLLKAWKHDGVYYFSENVMTYINDLLYNGSDTMEPVWVDGGWSVDGSTYKYFSNVIAYIESGKAGSAALSLYNDAKFLSACCQSGTDVSVSSYSYVFCSQPFVNSSFSVISSGKFVMVSTTNGSTFSVNQGSAEVDSARNITMLSNFPPNYVASISCYEKTKSLSGDLLSETTSQTLADLGFETITVVVDGADLTYYPVKLFPTLDDAENATQSEVQTDYVTSVPDIVVNVEDGKVIEVNRPGVEEVPDVTEAPEVTDPTEETQVPVDPGVDPSTPDEVDPSTPDEVDPSTPDEVDPSTPDEVDPSTPDEVDPSSPGSDTDPDTGDDSGSSGSITEAGLWGLLQQLADLIINGFQNIIQWLADTLLSGFRSIIEWLNNTLLAGMRSLWELATDWILTGIRDLFLPKEGYVEAKVQALTEKFSFADSIINTGISLKDFLLRLGSQPPIIYIDLGAATGSYVFGGKIAFIDLTWYAAYKPTVDSIVSAFLLLWFVWRVLLSLPGLIQGTSGFWHFSQSTAGSTPIEVFSRLNPSDIKSLPESNSAYRYRGSGKRWYDRD